MNIANLVRVSVLFMFAACSSGTSVGQSCTADAECGEFKCLHDKKKDANNACVDSTIPPEGTCSPPCQTHADCTKYGSTFKCALAQSFVDCNPTGICLDDYQISCSPGPCREAPAN